MTPKRAIPAAALVITAALYLSGAAMDHDRRPASAPDVPALPLPFRAAIISSSHQDIAWMDSPDACRRYRDENCITPALEMMRKNPDYRFVMENMLNLLEYVETHPERKDEIARFTREGRLEWGASFNQPYESLLSGEQLVRETYFGRRWLRKNFPGCDAKVYFNPDVPGRALQMQQILSKAGIPFMIISRYHEGFYRWGSPDGSSVLAYSPGHYGNASALLHSKPEEGVKALAEKLAVSAPDYRGRRIAPVFPLLNSEDFSKPADFGPLIGLWNRTFGASSPASTMSYSSARGFFEALGAGDPDFKTIVGERPNLWLYIHGPTHHWAIAAQREAARLLPAAETFASIASLLRGSFARYPARAFEDAWRAAIYPDHGWGGKEGQVTDRLFRQKYEFARDAGREIVDSSLEEIAGRVRTDEAKGVPVVVFNALSWTADAPVVVSLKKPAGRYVIADEAGNEAPAQVLPAAADGNSGAAFVQFVARGVPAIGYKTYYAADIAEPAVPAVLSMSPAASVHIVENSFYRLELVPGGIRSIVDKELGREILKTDKFLGFEIFTLQSVGNGAGEFGRVQQPTMEGFDKLGAHKPVWIFDAAVSGPVKIVYTLEQTLKSCRIRQRLTVYRQIKRIDCEVDLLGWDGDPYREFRIAVPVAAPDGRIAYEVPMGVVEVGRSEAPGTGGPAYGSLVYDEEMSKIRPREVQNFLDVSDAAIGVTLTTSVAVNDFLDPTTGPVSYPVLQPILLASRRSCHGQGNWYLQEGDHHYAFSLTSHAPGWRNGYRRGIAANGGLYAVSNPVPAPDAALPAAMSFVTVSADNVLIATIKKAEDDDSIVLRCYEMEGTDAAARIRLFAPPARAERTNIIEEDGSPLRIAGGAFVLTVGHQAIETVKLHPAQRK